MAAPSGERLSVRRCQCGSVKIGLEANQGSVAQVEYRALDHRRLGQHQLDGPGLVKIGLGSVVQFAEGGAGTIEYGLPAMLVAPGFQVGAVDSGALVVVELVVLPMFVEPGTGLFMVSQALIPYRHNR